jgi:hypothetical protein
MNKLERLFMEEYKELVNKHELTLRAVIDVKAEGIAPVLQLVEVRKEEKKEGEPEVTE